MFGPVSGSDVKSDVHIESKLSYASQDDAALARLGKKPVLRRNFVLVTWEGSLSTFLAGLQNGGPSGITYGFIVVWIGTLSIFATLSELASMAPTSGGQYHWVSMLAPPSSRKALGYMTGWLTITGWQSAVASGAYLTGTMIQGIILLTHPEYKGANWHGTLLLWGVILLAYGINTVVSSALARFEGFILILHILGFFAVVIPLAILSQHKAPADVFNSSLNLGGWQTQGLSTSIGIMGVVFAFLGGDGAIHLSEEIRNAAVVVPRSLMIGLSINGCLGFGLLVATLFSIGDLDQALAENPQYPFMSIFKHAVGSTVGAAVMSAIVIVMGFSSTVGCMASTSRLYWAFTRDHGLPGWKYLKQVSPRTGIPRYAVLVTSVVAVLLSLVNIGSATAFNGVISISIAGLFSSYLIPSVLLLHRRLTGGILDKVESEDDGVVLNTIDAPLTWGPWRLPGAFGVANNVFTCIYLIYIFFFSFWPSFREVNAANFNYAVVVFSAVVAFFTFCYLVWARKLYTGPVIETRQQEKSLG
ncbi:putative GABA permease [Xylariaceae sp. FL0594]|nr:putative GABA permease [Xylariaceae sp. FL0594]